MHNQAKLHNYWLYTLVLQDGKFYVGVTSKTPEQRFQQHLHGRGAYWTQEHLPVIIKESFDLGYMTYEEAQVEENRVVREYMKRYGINSTRGGDITSKDELGVLFGSIYDASFLSVMYLNIFLLLLIALLGAVYIIK